MHLRNEAMHLRCRVHVMQKLNVASLEVKFPQKDAYNALWKQNQAVMLT